MILAWVLGLIAGICVLTAWSIFDFLYTLFELPFDTWEVVKEKYLE